MIRQTKVESATALKAQLATVGDMGKAFLAVYFSDQSREDARQELRAIVREAIRYGYLYGSCWRIAALLEIPSEEVLPL